MPFASTANQKLKASELRSNQVANFSSQPENKICAECGVANPTWTSHNLGVFICLNCAGVHRGLGVHISKVKSILLDHWAEKETTHLLGIGNKMAAKTWEVSLPPGLDRRSFDMHKFIRAKYIDKLFTQPSKQYTAVQLLALFARTQDNVPSPGIPEARPFGQSTPKPKSFLDFCKGTD